MKKWFKKNSMNLFYLPALIIMLTFLVFPLANGFRLSFLKWNGYSPKTSFVGIQNYLSMLTDKNLGTAFRNTLLYGFGSTILQNILGLSAALFVNSRFKGHNAGPEIRSTPERSPRRCTTSFLWHYKFVVLISRMALRPSGSSTR